MSEVDVGALADFPEATPAAVRAGGRALVVVRIGDGVHVLEDRCSHEEFPLSIGEVDAGRCEIECERHGSMFDLRSGEPMSLPATKPVAVFGARVVEGHVIVELP